MVSQHTKFANYVLLQLPLPCGAQTRVKCVNVEEQNLILSKHVLVVDILFADDSCNVTSCSSTATISSITTQPTANASATISTRRKSAKETMIRRFGTQNSVSARARLSSRVTSDSTSTTTRAGVNGQNRGIC